jgi:hypothetical protein
MSERSVHYGKHSGKISLHDRPLTPEEIADYVHEEFTPYASMSLEDGKKHLAKLIHDYAVYFREKILTENDIAH